MPAGAYELATHARVSERAIDKSTLATSELVGRLGLSADSTDLGPTYVDLATSGTIRPRTANPFERLFIRDGFEFPNGMYGWILRGAIREDDGGTAAGKKNGEPLDDPDGNFNRFCNHFFDPYLNRALTRLCPSEPEAQRNPDWALGSNDAFAPEVVRAVPHRNHFSILGARDLMYRALTLQDQNGNLTTLTDTKAGRALSRKAYWASMFRALGDGVHLLQDMAQPQHTRDESHALGQATYEKYIDARATGARPFTIDVVRLTATAGTLRPLDYELKDASGNVIAYPTPRFNAYTDYWSTARGAAPRQASLDSGMGIADYSSRGFFTLGTSIGMGGNVFPSPPQSPTDPSYSIVTEPTLCDSGAQDLVKWQYLKRTAMDSAAPGTSDMVKVQSRSLWAGSPQSQRFSMNHCVFDDNARVLIPRAVAYSTGLLDYFFRGTMEISLPDDGVYGVVDQAVFFEGNPVSGFRKLKLKVKNTTPSIGEAQQNMVGGKLVAIVKFRRNPNYASDLSKECGSPGQTLANCRGLYEEIVVSTGTKKPDGSDANPVTLNSGAAAQEFHFTFDNAIPLNVTDVYLQVVYRGKFGSEADSVVVATKDIPEPTYFTIVNATDSMLCLEGQWIPLNADGSAPTDIDNRIIGYSPTTYTRVAISFRDPFPYPAWSNNPLVYAQNLQPGKFIRMAILTDDQKEFVYDIENFAAGWPTGLVAQNNQVTYPAGTPSVLQLTNKFRDTNHYAYTFGYRYYGTDCRGNINWPTGSGAPGGTYPIPTQVPINTVNF